MNLAGKAVLITGGRRVGSDLGIEAPRHQHLATHAADLRRLDRRPHDHLSRGTPRHQDGQLCIERDQLLDDDAAVDP